MITTPGSRGPPPDVRQRLTEAESFDSLAVHWRLALGVAEDALVAVDACRASLGFSEHELNERRGRLAQERGAAYHLLDLAARQQHIHLVRLTTPRATRQMVGLPTSILACVFDLDGVLTGSAQIHASVWAEAFGEFLSRRFEQTGERFGPFRPFSPTTDYYEHIHGKPRLEGIHAFLASRGIRLPEGRSGDLPDAETVHGLARRKNEALSRRLDREGVRAYADTRDYLEAAREAGLRLAVVSASANTGAILEHAGLRTLISTCVDGNTIRVEHLRSKPTPDTLLAASRQLGISPKRIAAFETTVAGVEAARAVDFGLVVGVNRPDQLGHVDLSRADVVINDLAALLSSALAT